MRSKPRIPDEIFRRLWGPCLGITDWTGWVLAPAAMNFTEAAAWASGMGAESIALASGDTLVRLPRKS